MDREELRLDSLLELQLYYAMAAAIFFHVNPDKPVNRASLRDGIGMSDFKAGVALRRLRDTGFVYLKGYDLGGARNVFEIPPWARKR